MCSSDVPLLSLHQRSYSAQFVVPQHVREIDVETVLLAVGETFTSK